MHHRLACALAAALSLFLLVVLAACGGQSSAPVQANALQASAGERSRLASPAAVPDTLTGAVTMQPQALAALPFDGAQAGLPTPAALLAQMGVEGDAGAVKLSYPAVGFGALPGAGGVTASGSYAVFSPSANPAAGFLAGCAYRFQLGHYAASGGRQTLRLGWDPERMPAEGQFWLGFANWARGGWDWYAGPMDGVLTIASFAPYLNAQGEALAAVLLIGKDSAALERLTVGAPEVRGLGALPSRTASLVPTTRQASAVLPGTADISAGCSAVADQGSVGSCTAFAVGNGAMNFELNRIYGNEGWDLTSSFNRVSPKYLYGVTGIDEGLGCPDDGRYLEGVVWYLTGNAIATSQNAPYTDVCNYSWSAAALADATLLKTKDYEYIPTGAAACINQIKTVIAVDQRPVMIGFSCDNGFMGYTGANTVWHYVGPSVGGHAVLIVGYDDSKSAFKIRNSWSSGWGNAGYAWIGYDNLDGGTGAVWEAYDMWAEYDTAVQQRFVPGAALVPPTDVAASDGTYNNRVHLAWTAVPGALGYRVYRAASPGGMYSQLGTATGPAYNDTTPTDVTVYWYKVASVSGLNVSSMSPSDPGNLQITAPTGIAASDGTFTDRVRITWTAVTGSDIYRVYRAESASGSYTLLGSTTAVQYDDPRADAAPHWYAVKASNGNGDSVLSAADQGNASLAAPLNVAASDGVFTDHVHLTWTPVPNATSYQVYRSASQQGNYALIATVPPSAKFDDFVQVATPFWYVVRSSNSDGDSQFSASDNGNASLASPTPVSASDGTFSDHVALAWGQASGATGYWVYRSPTQTGTYAKVGSTTGNTWNDTVGTADIRWYKVTASNASGESAPSVADAGHAGLAAPAAVTASDGKFNDHVHVQWDSVPQFTAFNVYRAPAENGAYLLLATVDTPQYDDYTSLTYAYWYKVKTVNGSALSAFSPADAGHAALAAPLGVAATDGTLTDRVHVSWDSVSGAASYNVYRSPAPLGGYVLLGNTADLAYDDPQAAVTTFWYQVRAVDAKGESWYAAPDAGHAGLAAPTGVAASDGQFADHVRITWHNVPGAAQYTVYRAATATGGYTFVGTTTQHGLDDFLPVAYTYWYAVKASNASGASLLSGSDPGNAAVPAPTGLQATDGTFTDRVRLTWKGVPVASSYKVYRWSGSAWLAIGNAAGPQYDDIVRDTAVHYYQVRAVGAVGMSLPSLMDSGYRGS